MSQPGPATPSVVTPKKNKGKRRFVGLLTLGTIVSVLGGAWYWWWTTIGQYDLSTDNAYVAGNIVQVTPQTTGTVKAVLVNNTDRVKAGQTLVELDETDAQVTLQAAEASLADAVRSVRSLYANTTQSNASVDQTKADLKRAQHQADQAAAQKRNAQDDYNRLANLRDQKFVSVEALNQAKATLDAADANLAAAQSAVNSAQAAVDVAQAKRVGTVSQTENTSVADHPKVQAAAAQVRQAYLTLERMRILAPASGDIAQRNVQVGARVAPGTALMAIIPPDQMWVDANFKETQLADLRIGQPVLLTTDLYGKTVPYTGKIAGFSAGTGSAFALLPAQNASGNWIKIVQRVPVRVELDPEQVKLHPLRIGLSMRVDVDTHDRTGPVIVTGSGEDKATLSKTDVFNLDKQPVDERIVQIIQANSGKNVP